MNTEAIGARPRRRPASRALRAAALAATLCVAAALASAQVPPAAAGAPASGAGYHDPRSAFKPLQERDGVLSWALLSSVTTRSERAKLIPNFPPAVQALHEKAVKVQGFMLPLEPGERQKHFLLSAVPTTCSFCIPAGPEGLIEVRTKAPVRYTVDAITLEGRLAVLHDDKFGLFYRVTEAVAAP